MKISQGRLRIGVATAVIVLGAGTVVSAVTPPTDPGETAVHGCYNRHTDKVRVVPRSEICTAGQTAMVWGPQPTTPGPKGDTGPQGPTGAQGPAGPAALDPMLVQVISLPVPATAGALKTQPVGCLPQQVAVSGGARLVQDALYKDSILIGSEPHATNRGQWDFSIRTDPNVSADWILTVLCYPTP